MKKISLFALILCLLASIASAKPEIKHEPVKAAVKGQAVYIRATVVNPLGSVKSVTLHCAASRDTAPSKVKMQDAGAGSFIGTVPDALLKNTDAIVYYIDALDEQDTMTETPWYTINLRAPAPGETGAKPAEENSWTTPLLIGGGIALIAGGAAIAVGVSGGGSDHSTATPSVTNAGTYAGSATRYFELPGAPLETSSYLITITILSDNTVTSDNLNAGTHLTANLSGSDFTMTAPVLTTNLTGQIRYTGTVLGGRISGSISGSAITPTGTNGTYSGVFSAVKQ